ncbi:MAG: hypothetical protein J0L97_08980 [Alphaproteobacteria bacterium]|nr:hypothetical protein [Alphaproteobacteria bacterium]
MKKLMAALVAGVALCAGHANAGEYTEYVEQCIGQYVAEGYDRKMTIEYCVCMDGLIPDGETRTVGQWAKSHPDEEKVCTKKAGWKVD